MAEDAIAKAGLYFDDLHKIRVLDPEISSQTSELKDECKDFLDSKFLCWMLVNPWFNRLLNRRQSAKVHSVCRTVDL